jgi:hypothetical protein
VTKVAQALLRLRGTDVQSVLSNWRAPRNSDLGIRYTLAVALKFCLVNTNNR